MVEGARSIFLPTPAYAYRQDTSGSGPVVAAKVSKKKPPDDLSLRFAFKMPEGMSRENLSREQRKLLRDIENNNVKVVYESRDPFKRKENALNAVDQLIEKFHFQAAFFIDQLPPEVLRLFYTTVIDRIKGCLVNKVEQYFVPVRQLGHYSQDEALTVAIGTMFAENPAPKERDEADGTGRGILQVGAEHRVKYAQWINQPEKNIDFLEGETCIDAWCWLSVHTTFPSLYPDKYGSLLINPGHRSTVSEGLINYWDKKYRQPQPYKAIIRDILVCEYRRNGGRCFTNDYAERAERLFGGGKTPLLKQLAPEDYTQAVLVAIKRNYADEWIPFEIFHNGGNSAFRLLLLGYNPLDPEKMDLENGRYNGGKFKALQTARLPVRFSVHYTVLMDNPWLLKEYYRAAERPQIESDKENYRRITSNPFLSPAPADHSTSQTILIPFSVEELNISQLPKAVTSSIDSDKENKGKEIERGKGAKKNIFMGLLDFIASVFKPDEKGPLASKQASLKEFYSLSFEQREGWIKNLADTVKRFDPETSKNREEYERSAQRLVWLAQAVNEERLPGAEQKLLAALLYENCRSIVTSQRYRRSNEARGKGTEILGYLALSIRDNKGFDNSFRDTCLAPSRQTSIIWLLKKIKKEGAGKYSPEALKQAEKFLADFWLAKEAG